MSEWKPIETAPKDGTPILLWGGRPDSSSDFIGFDTNTSTFPSETVVGWWEEYRPGAGEWRYCSYDSGIYGEWEDPTHWTPLPEPPR